MTADTCGARREDGAFLWRCTLTAGHTGDHVAIRYGRVRAVWQDER